jgi:hypothetical protein
VFNAPNKVLAVAKLLLLEGVGGGILPRSLEGVYSSEALLQIYFFSSSQFSNIILSSVLL